MTACLRDGCAKANVAWGFCDTHYRQERRAGRITPPTTVERFWAKVQKTDGCWLWMATRNRNGYGIFWSKDRHTPAHRYAYELLVAPIESGLTLDHQCHTSDLSCRGGDQCPHRACVNPEHLQPVTAVENTLLSRNALTSINAAKTECIRGHALEGENLRIDHRGYRQCVTCIRARQLAQYHARKASA